MKWLHACAMLEEVCLSGDNAYSELVSVTVTGLKSIDIHGDFTDDQVAYEIATCFKQNCILTHLTISKIKVSTEACLQMIDTLQYITTFQSLSLALDTSINFYRTATRISIVNGKRFLCLPKLRCKYIEHCWKGPFIHICYANY